MKVLHVIPSMSPVHGGPTTAMRLIADALAQAGVEVEIATTNDDGPGRVTDWPLECPRMPHDYRGIVFPRQTDFYKVSLPMLHWLRRHVCSYDIVHVHALFSFPSVAAAWSARRAGVPYVVRPLGVLARYGMTRRRAALKTVSMSLIERGLLRDAAAVHFTSERERLEAEDLHVPMRSVVVPLGVSVSSGGDAERFIARHTAAAGARPLLVMSRLDRVKNLEGLLHALALRRDALPREVLIVAGRGAADYEAELRKLARDLRLDDRVIWLGHVDGADKADALAAADLFVLPSHSENFGIAAAEALAAGIPCVLGSGVALAAEVEAAGAGVAVDPSPEAIALGIARLSGNPGALAAARVAAARLAVERYSAQRMAAQLLALYESILAADHAVRRA